MIEPWPDFVILFGVGLIAGTLNVIAGGGSMLTLPVMIFLGLPPTTANGTNRVAILVQNVGAVWGFHRHRIIDWSWLAKAAVPALLGVGLGAWAAVEVGDEAFRRILAGIIIVIALWTIWDPLKRRPVGDRIREPDGLAGRVALFGAFVFIGAYGGFIQAGVGFLILAVTTLIGLNLVRGNALKVLLVLTFTSVALVIFALGGKVEWVVGGVLAAGNLIGGQVGVHLTVLKGHDWVKRVVTVTVIVFAIRLWFP